jgi:hypothetical protein
MGAGDVSVVKLAPAEKTAATAAKGVRPLRLRRLLHLRTLPQTRILLQPTSFDCCCG